MAFDVVQSIDAGANVVAIDTSFALPNTTTNYTDELALFRFDRSFANRRILIQIRVPAAITGNLAIFLAGSNEADGSNPVSLVELRASAAIAAAATFGYVVDLNAFPARKYYIGFTASGNAGQNVRIAVFG